MAKLPMRCPFNGKMCKECPIFRGRHFYLCTNEHYRGYIKTVDKVESDKQTQHVDFNTIKKLCEPWSATGNELNTEPKIKLKVINKEAGTIQIYEPGEAKKWEWNNPEIMRTFNGIHIGSFNKLMEIIRYQEMKEAEEVTVVEAPWFMLA